MGVARRPTCVAVYLLLGYGGGRVRGVQAILGVFWTGVTFVFLISACIVDSLGPSTMSKFGLLASAFLAPWLMLLCLVQTAGVGIGTVVRGRTGRPASQG